MCCYASPALDTDGEKINHLINQTPRASHQSLPYISEVDLFNISEVGLNASMETPMVGVYWLRVAQQAVAITPNHQFL